MNTVSALATVPAIIALVTIAKDAGLRTSWASLLAVALGLALSVADYLFAGSGVWQAASSGVLLGLGAAGVYDAASLVSPRDRE